jgi:hypothetical protein
MKVKKAVNLTLEESTINFIDQNRGMIPRSTIIDDILKRSLESRSLPVTYKGEDHNQ